MGLKKIQSHLEYIKVLDNLMSLKKPFYLHNPFFSLFKFKFLYIYTLNNTLILNFFFVGKLKREQFNFDSISFNIISALL